MKHLRKFNESKEDASMDDIFNWIKSNWSKSDISEKVEKEILNWVDPKWEETEDSEIDWYKAHNNGEAEDVVIDEIINRAEKEFKTKIAGGDRKTISDKITNEFNL